MTMQAISTPAAVGALPERMYTLKVGRTRQAEKRLTWVRNLPEVGHPILYRLDRINRLHDEIKELQAELHRERTDIIREIATLWSASEIRNAPL